MYRNIVSIGVQCTQKVYMYRNIVSVGVQCTQKVYMYKNIVSIVVRCTQKSVHVQRYSVCYRFLYKPLVQNSITYMYMYTMKMYG